MAHVKKAMGFALVALLVALGIAAAPQDEKASAQAQAEKNEVKNFVLTSDKLDKFEAAIKATRKVQKENPDLKKQMDDENSRNSSNTIAGSVATIEKYPALANAIKNSGIAPAISS